MNNSRHQYYKQYYFINKMIERKTFDKQINSIKEKYQRLCHTKATSQPITLPEQYCTQPVVNHYLFTTPVKYSKSNQEGHLLSKPAFQETHERPAGELDLLKRRISVKKEHRGQQADRICLTSRQPQGKEQVQQFIKEKESIIRKRMEENQRLLRKSKEIRDSESRKDSTARPNSNTSNAKPGYSELPPKNIKRETLAKENSAPSYFDLKTNPKKAEASNLTLKSTADELNKKAKNLFAEKISNLINSNQAHQKAQELTAFKSKPEPVRKQNVENNIVSFMKNGTQAEQNKALKMVTVFDNTTKIQERIKALLSSH